MLVYRTPEELQLSASGLEALSFLCGFTAPSFFLVLNSTMDSPLARYGTVSFSILVYEQHSRFSTEKSFHHDEQRFRAIQVFDRTGLSEILSPCLDYPTPPLPVVEHMYHNSGR